MAHDTYVQSDTFTENYLHKTQSRPFSLHHIHAPHDMQTLYLHCHSEIELFYLVSGKINFFIEDKSYTLNSGDAIMVPPNLLHYADKRYRDTKDVEFYAIVFSTDMLAEILPSYCERYLLPIAYHATECIIPIYNSPSETWQADVFSCLDNIFDAMDHDIKYNELIIRGNLLIIWQLLYNNHMLALMKKTSGEHIQPYLKKCVDYIDQNYTKQITLDTLSHMAGLSTGHFCRQFKEFTGYTPFSYLNKRRISKSCTLLLNTDKKIAEIASLCGFNNISYYNRAFIKIMKESPSSYRKNFTYRS